MPAVSVGVLCRQRLAQRGASSATAAVLLIPQGCITVLAMLAWLQAAVCAGLVAGHGRASVRVEGTGLRGRVGGARGVGCQRGCPALLHRQHTLGPGPVRHLTGLVPRTVAHAPRGHSSVTDVRAKLPVAGGALQTWCRELRLPEKRCGTIAHKISTDSGRTENSGVHACVCRFARVPDTPGAACYGWQDASTRVGREC
jgi:hypothetical protein